MKKYDLPSTVSSQNTPSSTNSHVADSLPKTTPRRSFLKGIGIAGAALSAGTLLATRADAGDDDRSGSLTRGDAAILRFLAAAEIIETDLWLQYQELGGVQDTEFSSFIGGNPLYTKALAILDEDMDQYIHDNTDDEITHFKFLNAYLESKGAAAVDLDPFRVLAGSTATGSSGKPRLTNLMQLTLDTRDRKSVV